MRHKKVLERRSRQLVILGLLEYNHIMSRNDLCAYTDISPSTLAKDLRALRRDGCVIESQGRSGLLKLIRSMDENRPAQEMHINPPIKPDILNENDEAGGFEAS